MKILTKYIYLAVFTIYMVGQSLIGQVYISNSYDGEIFIGPDNVLSINSEVIDTYSAELSKAIGLLNDNLLEIEYLRGIEKKKRRDRKRLSQLLQQKEDFVTDIQNFNHLLKKWNDPNLANFSLENQYCYYDSDSLTNIIAEPEIIKDTIVIEFVDCDAMETGTRWIKKKADGKCLSTNPDDCLIWCLVQVNNFEINDMTGNKLLLNDTEEYFQFKYSEMSDRIKRKSKLILQYDRNLYRFKSAVSRKIIPFSEIELCNKE